MSREGYQSAEFLGSSACALLDPCERPMPAARQAASPNKRIARENGLLKVLVADDNHDAADTLALLVGLWGHDARRVYDGAEALELAQDYRPDVLLLDIAMPRIDGCRLASLLRQQDYFKNALLIAVTGYADEAHHRMCFEAGFDHFVVKPGDPAIVELLLVEYRDRLAGPPQGRRASSLPYVTAAPRLTRWN